MKKLLTLFLAIFMAASLWAQAPQAFKYQMVARNNAGEILASQNISFRMTVLQGALPGTVVYAETHLATTNAFGLVTLDIGRGTQFTGSFETINWSITPIFLKTEIDPAGGSAFVEMGTSELLSVPFAQYAQSSGSASPGNNPGDILYWNGTQWVILPQGLYGQTLTSCNGILSWNGCIPLLTTTDVTSITGFTAYSGGTITNSGAASIVAKGVCWNTSSNPTTDNSRTIDGSGSGTYFSNLTGLTPNTTYYVRAYATNSAGTGYGNELSFTTQSGVVILETTAASAISTTTALSGGNITNNGGGVVTVRGVCWSTSQNPTTADSKTTNGSGSDVFESNITGLTSNTVYYARAYATNSVGTFYGSQINFTTMLDCGSLTINHLVSWGVAPVSKTVTYNTVTNVPGETSKCWITSNLGADHQATAVNDATEASAGWYWQFNRKQGYKHDGTSRTPNTSWISSFNENSNWTTANDPCALELGTGWRIPTFTEWTNVEGWTTWTGPWNSGLKMHAAGFLYSSNGSLYSLGYEGDYWSSSQYSASGGYNLSFTSVSSWMYQGTNKANGYSLRCLKD